MKSSASALLAATRSHRYVRIADSKVHLVADQVAHLFVECPRDLAGDVDILILLLPQPPKRVRKEDSVAPLVGPICAGAMQSAAHPEQHGPGRHRGRNDFIGPRDAIGGPQMAAGNYKRAAVGFGEIGYRPHAGENHSRERHLEKLVRILLAVEHLFP